jgi:hypothetical protein
MCEFAIDDLFVVGLGLDIVGAYLLGRGLLMSVIEIARRSASWVGYSSIDAVNLVRDRLDGVAGLTALLAGFTLQAIAYAVTLAHHEDAREGTVGRSVTALVLAVTAGGIVLGLRRLVGPRLVKKALIDLAHVNVFKSPPEIRANPYGALLVSYGGELGYAPLENETQESYAKRVFGVGEIEQGGPRRA